MRKNKSLRGTYRMTIYFDYKMYERFFKWLLEHWPMCMKVTGEAPFGYFDKPICDGDIGRLPYTSATFPSQIQWWINKNCPYRNVKVRARARLKTKVLNWWYYKIKKS